MILLAKIILREYLDERGIKSNWLSERVGLSSAALSKLLNGKTDSIKLDFLEKICTELDCSIEDVVRLDKDCK